MHERERAGRVVGRFVRGGSERVDEVLVEEVDTDDAPLENRVVVVGRPRERLELEKRPVVERRLERPRQAVISIERPRHHEAWDLRVVRVHELKRVGRVVVEGEG